MQNSGSDLTVRLLRFKEKFTGNLGPFMIIGPRVCNIVSRAQFLHSIRSLKQQYVRIIGLCTRVFKQAATATAFHKVA